MFMLCTGPLFSSRNTSRWRVGDTFPEATEEGKDVTEDGVDDNIEDGVIGTAGAPQSPHVTVANILSPSSELPAPPSLPLPGATWCRVKSIWPHWPVQMWVGASSTPSRCNAGVDIFELRRVVSGAAALVRPRGEDPDAGEFLGVRRRRFERSKLEKNIVCGKIICSPSRLNRQKIRQKKINPSTSTSSLYPRLVVQ